MARRRRNDDRLPEIMNSLRESAVRFGTPLYLTDLETLDAAAREVKRAFPDPWIRQYSLKANDAPAIVARIAAWGFGANVVSAGEWWLARRAGVPEERISFEGIGKREDDLRLAVKQAAGRRPPRWVSIESADEAAALTRLASSAGLGEKGRPRLDILLRFNPGVRPRTHAGLRVGSGDSKFGMQEHELPVAVEAGGGASGRLRWRGIHVHVGSQLGALGAWRQGATRALAVFARLRKSLPDLDTLDLGGGFPVGRNGPLPSDFARAIRPLLAGHSVEERPRRLAIEPGRFLVARAGWIVAGVLHVRTRRVEGIAAPLAVIDAGMTELIRPALYGAHHSVLALTSHGGPPASRRSPTWVEGPICEATDRLGQHRLTPLRRGDLVAIADAGAYAASMSSRYNGRPRPPQILLEKDGRLIVGIPRGSPKRL